MNVEEKVFKKGDSLEGDSFVECRFEAIDFSGLDLSKKRYAQCQFVCCNWTAVKLENTRLQEVIFIESKIMGVDFTLCDEAFLNLYFEKCLLNGCNFTEMKLKKGRFVESDVKECHFVQTDLREADFKKSNLAGTVFHKTNLENANFTDTIFYSINPLNNSLKGAKFSKPEALSLLDGLEIKLT